MILKLKELHISLGRAIESGDNLQIGIVVGQVFKELENIINEAQRNTVSELLHDIHQCGECLNVRPRSEGGPVFRPEREEGGSDADNNEA